jgi:signal recognition particle GTPase
VNVGVVRSVLARIRDKAVGAEVSKALDPAQQVVKTVHAERESIFKLIRSSNQVEAVSVSFENLASITDDVK